jgi:hypothetical protein
MNSNFDLNINNYTIGELEELFELRTNYNEADIDSQQMKLKLSIINDNSLISKTKTNTIEFINAVKITLHNNLNKNGLKKNDQNNIIGKLESTFNNIYNLDKTLTPTDVIDSSSTYIIKQQPTSYGQSSPSEFYQGTINPLNKRILRQNINIDTRFRDNYYITTSSNFHADLPIKLSKVVSLQLSALELPNTFYSISKVFKNNFFSVSSPDIIDEPLIINVPDGNYDYLALQQYINGVLSTTAYSGITFFADISVSSTYGSDSGSGRMVVGLNDTAVNITSFTLNFLTDESGNEDNQTPLPLKLGWLLGFRYGSYQNNVTYVSEGLINLQGPRYIYLVVNDYNNNVLDGFYGAFTSSILNKNILARISLQGSIFNYLSKDNFNLTTTPRQYFGPVDIQKLQIQLLDEYGRILNLNNMDYSFCLTFQTIYDL